eukprot:CAMPEP_0168330820 /NCGR_PEP_ID=MMETSP0213-20121227/7968_1 /TAXON_ID=151035 /ORGANISM="Euplotes harpa, Strain FSP1.4" /LENGTH=126 /DNA_ID=CAMNT_0008334483 /DNA_START=106 /DNA_END=486 /DNA_ORIENTATION=-
MTVLSPPPPTPALSSSIVLNIVTPYASDTSYWLDDIALLNLVANTKAEASVTFTCSVSGSSTITVEFSSDQGNLVPSWGSVDLVNSKLKFSIPDSSTDKTYTFTLKTSSSEFGSAYYSSVKLAVKP